MSEAEEKKKKIATEMERKLRNEEKAKEKEMKKQRALEKARSGQVIFKSTKPKTISEKKKIGNEDEAFVDPETPLGEKKKLSSQMPKQYNPSSVEKSWYEWWEKSEFFKADAKSSKPSFVIVLPPPNVTGALHIGHALTCAIQDTLIRWKRMSGFNALWVPGFDHAGIATQLAVEKRLTRETGKTRHDFGREEFLNHVWQWKNKYGCTIQAQLRRMGSSLDWSRECFTMDEQRSKAVTEAFVKLHKEGLIYRDEQIVHWDCFLRTALSKSEVKHIDLKERTTIVVPGYENPVEFGVITSFAYPLERGGGEVVVATTRVETMLGDTAIAVHPDDARYKHLHGEFAVHPFNGRKLPIICDEELVDPSVGTGCVKITPAHNFEDFEVRKRHNLECINILTDDGRINANGGHEFAGMPRFAAREAVVGALRKKGLYRGVENKEMSIGVCSRSNDVVEPMIKPQWYVSCGVMAKEALDVAANGKIEFIPKQYSAEWRRWLENIHDWCISRQLWWGHRIPVWYATLEEDDQLKEAGPYNDHWVVARNEEEARKEAADKFAGKKLLELSQDPDVLDTWFSSGLFPLSVLGWPDQTEDLKAFYPTSVLETGHDILFFWVARMVMLGMKVGGGDVPFRKVFFHPMIRDAHGRKMSKSLGNGIDPLEVIHGVTLERLHARLEEGNLDPKEMVVAKEGQVKDFPNGIPECGADALRFALVSYTAQSDKINMDVLRVVGYRQWCNKLWNAVRFAMMKLGDAYTPPVKTLSPKTMPFSCQWILSVLNKAISKTVDSLNAFELSDATNTVYAWWYQFCDVFIEAVKPYFSADNPSRTDAQDTLWVCLETGLRLLHPFMPFITEELWQRLPSSQDCERKASIMICDYPSPIEKWTNDKVEAEMDMVLATVFTLRALRAAKSLERQRNEIHAFALCENALTLGIVQSHELEIRTLANLSSFEVVSKGEDKAAQSGSAVVETVNENLKVYLKVDGAAIDAEADREKTMNRIKEIQKQQEKLQKVMGVSGYEEKVPANIKEENLRKLKKLIEELQFLIDHLQRHQ